jgi:hypothetical protein
VLCSAVRIGSRINCGRGSSSSSSTTTTKNQHNHHSQPHLDNDLILLSLQNFAQPRCKRTAEARCVSCVERLVLRLWQWVWVGMWIKYVDQVCGSSMWIK